MRKKFFQFILITVMTGALLNGCANNKQSTSQPSENIMADNTKPSEETDSEEALDQPSQSEEETVSEDETSTVTEQETTNEENTTDNSDAIVNVDENSESDNSNKAESQISENNKKPENNEKPEANKKPESSQKPESTQKPESSQKPENNNTPAHKHSYVGSVTKEATCTESGVKTFTCSCGDSYTEEVTKLNHSASDWKITKEATCKTTGTKIKSCTSCGTQLESKTIEKTGHTSGDWIVTKEATCNSNGKKVKNCTVCGVETASETIASNGSHSWQWKHISSGDYKVNVCSGCGTESGTRAYNLGNGIYGYYDDAAARDLFNKVNKERNNSHTVIIDEVTLEVIGMTNVPSLIWRDENIAKKRALDIVTNFSHDGYVTDNENLARGQGTAKEVCLNWYNSSTHRQTMFAIDYVYGSTACLWVDSDGNGTMYPYWTLVLSIQ